MPEPLGQISHGGVFELLLLAGGELVLAGAGGQQGCACGSELAGGNCLSGQLHQVGLLHQFRQRGQPDRHTFEFAALQLLTQVKKGLGILLEGGGGDRNQQQGRAGAPPIALQQAQLAGHGINEQLGIVGQVIGVVFEHRRQVGDQLVVVAVEASGGHGFHPHPRMAAEPQPGVGSHRGHALAQFARAGHPRAAVAFTDRQAGLLQHRGDAPIGRRQGHQHLLGPEGGVVAPLAGIEIRRGDEAGQQQISQPGEALGPEQGHVVIGQARLAAGLAPFGGDVLGRHQIELRQQGGAVHLNAQLRQLLAPAPGLLPAFLAAGGDQLVGQEQGPFAFDVLELGQLLALVVQAGAVFHQGLVAVAAEALVAVAAAQVAADFVAGAFHQLGILHGPGRVADHREAGAVHLLAGRFARQQAAQGPPQAHDRIVGNGEAAAAIAVGAVEVEPLQRFEGCLDQADRAGIALRQAVVALVAALPDAVISHPVGPRHVIGQVLDEVALVAALHDHQARAGQLGQLQQKQGGGIEL